MRNLDNVDLRTLLQLEADLTEMALHGFLEFVRGRYRLAHIAYICPSFGWGRIKDPFLALAYSDAWFAHRQAQGEGQGEARDNLFGAEELRRRHSLEWSLLPRVKAEIARLLNDAADAGTGRQGLVIPVSGPMNGLSAIFVATSHEGDAEWSARRDELMKDMVQIAHYVHQRARHLHVQEDFADLDEIAEHEITALKLFAEGNRLREIAILMRISPETVRAVLNSARHKLQALNSAHAIAKALRAGLID